MSTAIGILSFFSCFWYLILHMPFAAINGSEKGVVLYFIGLVFIIIATLLSYVVAYLVLKKVNQKSFVYGVIAAFFCGDILLRINMFFGWIPAVGFLGLIIYSVFFISIMLCVWHGSRLIDWCDSYGCKWAKVKFDYATNKTSAILSKFKKV